MGATPSCYGGADDQAQGRAGDCSSRRSPGMAALDRRRAGGSVDARSATQQWIALIRRRPPRLSGGSRQRSILIKSPGATLVSAVCGDAMPRRQSRKMSVAIELAPWLAFLVYVAICGRAAMAVK